MTCCILSLSHSLSCQYEACLLQTLKPLHQHENYTNQTTLLTGKITRNLFCTSGHPSQQSAENSPHHTPHRNENYSTLTISKTKPSPGTLISNKTIKNSIQSKCLNNHTTSHSLRNSLRPQLPLRKQKKTPAQISTAEDEQHSQIVKFQQPDSKTLKPSCSHSTSETQLTDRPLH